MKTGQSVGQVGRRGVWRTLTVLLLTASLSVAGSTSQTNKLALDGGDQTITSGRTVENLGITISGLRLSSAGYMLDFRYRVVDTDKAAALMDAKIKPYMLVESSGARLDIPNTPKLGLLRQRPRNNAGMKKDREYFMMFSNLGRRLQSGDKVTVVVGDTKIENLSIQ